MSEIKGLGNKERFLKIYVNLPISVRQEIILVLGGKPITWNIAFIEVKAKTALSEIILAKLKKLRFI